MTQEDLVDLAERAFSKSPWHSLMASLNGVSDGAFVWVPHRHNGFPWMDGSIRDIVYHIAGDKLVQLSHAFGDATVSWETLVLEKGPLDTMVADLVASHEAFVTAIRACEDLTVKVTGWGGKRLRAADFFRMLIEHDMYHAGQVRYIRNLVE